MAKDIVCVDLSANAEQISQDSAIAVANNTQWVYLARSRVKRYLEQRLSERYGRRNLQYRLLAVLIYLAVREHLNHIQQIIVDKDYSGELAESTLKNYLLAMLRRSKPDIGAGFVVINNIKGSNADKLARSVFQGRLAPNAVITVRDIDEVLQQ